MSESKKIWIVFYVQYNNLEKGKDLVDAFQFRHQVFTTKEEALESMKDFHDKEEPSNVQNGPIYIQEFNL